MAKRHALTRNRKLTKPDISAHLTLKQRRFLAAYATCPWEWAKAARLAGVHRCSAYRWLNDPAFDAARTAIEDAERQRLQRELAAEDAKWRERLAHLRAEAEARADAMFLLWRERCRRRRRCVAFPKFVRRR